MRLPWNKKYMEIGFHVIVTIWLLVASGAVLVLLLDAKTVVFPLIRRICGVLAPIFWALFFALLLEPAVAFFQRQYEKRCTLRHRSRIRNRKAGTAAAYLALGALLFAAGSFAARKIGGMDVELLTAQVRDWMRRAGDLLVLVNVKLAEAGLLQNAEGLLSTWTAQAEAAVEAWMLAAANRLPGIGGSLLDVAIGAAAAFYFLMEKERMLTRLGTLSAVLLGKRLTGWGRRLFLELYTVISGYLSGQLLDAAIMAVLFSGAFLVVGLPHAVALGLLSGFSNLIPYFGAVTAFLLAVLTGLLSGAPAKAVTASVLILLLQQVDSLFIVPKAVGRRVELHPVLVLLSLAVFGRLFGFWGLLFAVPLGALLRNFLFWLYEKKKRQQEG